MSSRYASGRSRYGYGQFPPTPSPEPSTARYSAASNPYATHNFRTATPNKKGQYSTQTLESLESQNDEEIEGLGKKVKMLKDITVAIGQEVRDSTSLMETMNNQFDAARRQLKGTMRNMLRMAARTGVGWKVWVLFFIAVGLVFFWVWI